MRAALDNLAIAHNKNAVRVTNGTQAMRDHKARATCHKLIKRLLDLQLGTSIDTRGRLIQQENRRIGEHHAGNEQKLFLALAKRAAILADHGVIPLRQLSDKLVGMRSTCRLDHLLACGICTTVRDVLVYRPLK